MKSGTQSGRRESQTIPPLVVLRRQLAVGGAFVAILTAVVASIYVLDRRAEWAVRTEQSRHRVETAAEMIASELQRVRTDALYLASQVSAREFFAGSTLRRDELEADYRNFVRNQRRYDQIRLIDLSGIEVLRVNYVAGQAVIIQPDGLQDKHDRYYFRNALHLQRGEVFVSEFDLNQEYGVIEQPIKPVIRVVTPVPSPDGEAAGFLVLNFLGARLLEALDAVSLPGSTLLVRPDGHYVHGPRAPDSWGWLLSHSQTFPSQFASDWPRLQNAEEDVWLSASGAFSARRLWLGRGRHQGDAVRDWLWVVAYTPARAVFADSTKLLQRLLVLTGCMMVPLMILAWYWAHASLSRQQQMRWIADSEERLRELSARLLRIQEDERRAISREIHDELGQQATAVSLDMKLAERNLADSDGKQHLQRAIAANNELLKTLHAFATRVRPAVLDDLGLYDALESHISEFELRTGIRIHADLNFRSEQIPNEVADNAYRLLQEALNNVAKHADATTVEIAVDLPECDPDGGQQRLTLEVFDDGRGYEDTSVDAGRLGLVGMRERVDLLDGQLTIETGANQGTRITIELPIASASAPVVH